MSLQDEVPGKNRSVRVKNKVLVVMITYSLKILQICIDLDLKKLYQKTRYRGKRFISSHRFFQKKPAAVDKIMIRNFLQEMRKNG